MQFALFLYDDERFHDLPEAEQMTVVSAHMAYGEALEKAGVFVHGEPLDHSRDAKTLRDDATVQDGPYADTKEQMGGFYIIDVADWDAALDWAKKSPTHTHGGHVEVRPIPNYAGG
ncbi:MAG: YciI family protein [Pseudomonadota bacterium]